MRVSRPPLLVTIGAAIGAGSLIAAQRQDPVMTGSFDGHARDGGGHSRSATRECSSTNASRAPRRGSGCPPDFVVTQGNISQRAE
jgi:hypothetical protein